MTREQSDQHGQPQDSHHEEERSDYIGDIRPREWVESWKKEQD